MSKFGDLIEGEKPILLAFYDGVENEEDSIQPLLLDVVCISGVSNNFQS